ncbi:MAG: hypothetical protein LBV14_11045 [Acidovorax sp.]|nr:hypothetical protein [Acidovorax sp.]
MTFFAPLAVAALAACQPTASVPSLPADAAFAAPGVRWYAALDTGRASPDTGHTSPDTGHLGPRYTPPAAPLLPPSQRPSTMPMEPLVQPVQPAPLRPTPDATQTGPETHQGSAPAAPQADTTAPAPAP